MLEESQKQQKNLRIRDQEISRYYNKTSSLELKNEELEQQIKKITKDKDNKQKILNKINQDLAISNRERDDLAGQVSTLNKQVQILLEQSEDKKQELDGINVDLQNLMKERSHLLQEINRLGKENKKLKNEINRLQEKLNNLLESEGEENEQLYEGDTLNDDGSIIPTVKRELTGRYLGNISNSKNKYHWSHTCVFYKSLAFEYLVMREGKKRTIINTDDREEFKRYDLGPCDTCSNQKKYK